MICPESKKKSVDIDESVFEDDREFLYEGITMESSKEPLWGMPSVNTDKLTALENTCRNGDHAEFQPYYRTLRPIAFEEKDTTPESIFNSSLGSYAMHRESESVKSEENVAVQKYSHTGEGAETRGKIQSIGSMIDDSRKEVLSQKINSDNSGYVILAFLGALLLFTIVIVSFTRLIFPGLSADSGKNEQEASLKEAQAIWNESEYGDEEATVQNPDENPDADLDAVAGTRFELNGYCAQNYNGNLYLTVEEAYSVNAADSFGTAHYYDDVREFLLTSDDSEILENLGEHQVTASGTLYAIDEECVGFKVDNVEILDRGARTELDYCDSDTITYPVSPADFTQVTSPDGAYTLMYPKSVFAEGYYDEDMESYYFSSADGSLTWIVEKQEAPVKNNPVSCANYMMNSVSSLFVEGDGTPYSHESSTVSESGFSRAIIGGQTKSDPGKGKYILYACSNENVFVFEFTFPYGGTSGITIDYTECGYMLDCMYRGWSISGSTRELRSFDQYMNDDMGAKKED